jgi:hypothetical protein
LKIYEKIHSFFVATVEECAPKKFHWWHYPHNWLPKIGFSAGNSKLLFHGEVTKANCTTNWCAAHDSRDSINKSIQDYELWMMPYDHAYDP